MKLENLLLWILILLTISIALWKIFGSPTDTASLIAIALFIAGSEILLWKQLFKIEKNVSIGFIKLKQELNQIKTIK